MPKGWVYEPIITKDEILLLYNSLRNHSDSYLYRPIAIAKREEIGMKYRFLCIANPINYPNLPSHFADVGVYKPVLGMPYVTHLNRLEFEDIQKKRE
jgi:hypothetical protein